VVAEWRGLFEKALSFNGLMTLHLRRNAIAYLLLVACHWLFSANYLIG
jgi:hypothetical protein